MNAMAAQISIAVGVRGPMLTLNEVDVAGDLAVARGAALVASGRASAVLAGGCDELSLILYRELSRLGTMSRAEPGPEGCRPFDRRANGTVLGRRGDVPGPGVGGGCAEREACTSTASWRAPHGAISRRPPTASRTRGRRDPADVRRALGARPAATAEAIDVAYLTGAGHPAHDACELDLVARALRRGRARLTALTPLVGEHAGLGGPACGRRRARRGGLRGGGAPRPAEPIRA